MPKYALVAAGLLVSVVLGATVFSSPIAWAAQTVSATIVGPLDSGGDVAVHEQGTANVNVTNTTLPVHEQGTANVAVTNLPTTQQVSGTVTQAAETVEIAQGTLDASQPSITVDASPFAEIRITTRTSFLSCSAPASILVGAPYRIATFTVDPGRDASELVELPGRSVEIVNSNASVCDVFFHVFGRAN